MVVVLFRNRILQRFTNVLFLLLMSGCVHFITSSSTESTVPVDTESTTTATEGLNDERSATLELMTKLRKQSVVKEKVAPLFLNTLGYTIITVEMTVSVVSVLGVDDVQQTVKTTGFLYFEWQDDSLAWNASDYMGVRYVEIPGDAIWKPSVRFSNAANDQDLLNREGLILVVNSSGGVSVMVDFLAETTCDMDLTNYPFDRQWCPLFMLSYSYNVIWTLHQDTHGKQAAREYSVGTEWDLLQTSVQTDSFARYEIYAATVNMEIKRKTTFYTVCLILPMVVTSYMNTLVFLLPLQSGEKISFLVSIFVSTSVYVSYFTSVMPRGLQNVPNSMKLLIGVIVESSCVLLATTVVLRRFRHSSTSSPPPTPSKPSTPSTSSTSTTTPLCRREQHVDDERDPSAQDAKSAEDLNAVKTKSAAKGGLKWTAEQLDQLFFVLIFVGNTVFLAALLVQSATRTD